MLIGTHIFCDFSPLNWFESANIDDITSELDSTMRHGFNCIFITVPCAPILYDTEQASEFLIAVLKEARSRNLEVHIRACYLWESGIYPTSTYRLLSHAMYQQAEYELLVRYFDILRSCIDSCETATVKVFISWEDFYWPIFRHWPSQNEYERKEIAHTSGYEQFVNLLCSTSTMAVIPASHDASIPIFISFFDSIILPRIIRMAKEKIGAIGYEYRIDSDEMPNLTDARHRNFYHWNRSHPYIDQSYIYFHQNIGVPTSKSLSGEDAALNLRTLLRTMAPMFRHGEKLPIIDQFNFVDSTENSWAALKNDALNLKDFFMKCREIINESASGVVLWSYRDWPKDIVFNGKFRHAGKGWKISGDVIFEEHCQILAAAGAELAQVLNLDLPDTEFVTIRVMASPADSLPASLSVMYGENILSMPCNGENIIVKLPYCENKMLIIKVTEGHVRIMHVSVYDRIYSQGGKSENGNTSDSFEAFLAFGESFAHSTPFDPAR